MSDVHSLNNYDVNKLRFMLTTKKNPEELIFDFKMRMLKTGFIINTHMWVFILLIFSFFW